MSIQFKETEWREISVRIRRLLQIFERAVIRLSEIQSEQTASVKFCLSSRRLADLPPESPRSLFSFRQNGNDRRNTTSTFSPKIPEGFRNFVSREFIMLLKRRERRVDGDFQKTASILNSTLPQRY